jgi:DNA-binding NarL/FixJ family response regulator
MRKIKIAIADDEQLFREGVRFLINKEPNFKVVFEAKHGQEMINFLKKTSTLPDILLMDLRMPILNGVETTKIVQKLFRSIKIIILSSYTHKSFVLNMINLGASSYLIKNETPKTVVNTINKVFKKGFYYDTNVTEILHENLNSSGTKKTRSHLDKNYLSKREIEVLELICKQFTTLEIANILCISPRTVEGHRTSLLLKSESKNTAGLVIYGIQREIIELSIL